MKPEIKTMWLEALRSGRYVQTTKALHDEIGFCCLGVLCDISNKGAWSPDSYYELEAFSNDQSLSHPLQVWSGVEGASGNLPAVGNGEYFTLAELNDDGLSFNQIADVIENLL